MNSTDHMDKPIQYTLCLVFFCLVSILPAQIRTHDNGEVTFSVIRDSKTGMLRGLSGWNGRSLSDNFRYPVDGQRQYLGMYSDIWIGTAKDLVAGGWNLDGKSNWVAEKEISQTDIPNGTRSTSVEYEAVDIDLNLLVTQRVISWGRSTHPDADDFVVIQLTITNGDAIDLKDVYVAICADWNMDQVGVDKADFSKDWFDYNKELSMLYAYDGDDSDGLDPVHAGLILLDGKLATHQIFPIKNQENGQLNTAVFAPAYRSPLISDPNRFYRSKISARNKADLDELEWTAWDYVAILSAGRYDIRAKQSIQITFGLVAGKSKSDLLDNAQMAKWITYSPQNITLERSQGLVKLQWEPAINYVDGYQVRRLTIGENNLDQLGPRILNSLRYDDATVERGIRYRYTILPVVGNALEELASKPIDTALASTPENVILTDQDKAVLVTWNKPLYVPAGYYVFRRAEGESDFRQITPDIVKDLTFADVEVETGVEYVYRVRPLDTKQQPLAFDSNEVRILPVFPPSRLYTERGTKPDSITVHWPLVSERIAGYNVYRSYNGIEPWTRIASISKSEIQNLSEKPDGSAPLTDQFSVLDQIDLHFVDPNVYSGSTYYYMVTALNQEGRESQASTPTERLLISDQNELSTQVNLLKIFTYPSPWQLLKYDRLTFANLMGQVVITIFTPNGDLVHRIDHINGKDKTTWDGRNKDGRLISPGVYIYHVETLNPQIVGKISFSGQITVFR